MDYDTQDDAVDYAQFSNLFTPETAQKVKQSEMEPAGLYTSNPDEAPLTVKESVMPATELYPARPILDVSGRVFHPDTGRSARLSFKMSGVQAFEQVYEGEQGSRTATGVFLDGQDGRALKYDWKTRLYRYAYDAYEKVNGEPPQHPGYVAEYLRKFPVTFKLYQGRDGLKIDKIFAAK